MSGFYSIARTSRYALLGARIPRSLIAVEIDGVDREDFALVDLLIDEGRIGAIVQIGRAHV